jgi:Tfp pilus assembly protein PilO
MSEITLKTIDEKLAKVLTLAIGTAEDVAQLKTDVAKMSKTLNSHTTVLDGLAKDVKTLGEEKAVTADRVEGLETWAQKVAPKVNVRLQL